MFDSISEEPRHQVLENKKKKENSNSFPVIILSASFLICQVRRLLVITFDAVFAKKPFTVSNLCKKTLSTHSF